MSAGVVEVGVAGKERGEGVNSRYDHCAGVIERAVGLGLGAGFYERAVAIAHGRQKARVIHGSIGAGGAAGHTENPQGEALDARTKSEHMRAALTPTNFFCPP